MIEKDLPLVSVIINCYNGEQFLKSAINSVIIQSYQRWEIVFWDNCSTDNSALILSSFKDERIKYFLSPYHTSLGEARNMALEKASGEYIAFLDTDDLWFDDFLLKAIRAFQKNDISVFYSNYYQFNNKSRRVNNLRKYSRLENFSDILSEYHIGMSASMIDYGFLKKSGICFNNNYSLIEDYDLYLRIAYLKPIYYCSEVLALYRMHSFSLTMQSKNGWGKELSMLYSYLVNTLLSKEDIYKNKKSLKWLKVRSANAYISEAIEKNDRRNVLKLVLKNCGLSAKLLFHLVYFFGGKRFYYKCLYYVRRKNYYI
ncbi:MAG: hypothetical protein PARBA_00183 [Parabacteroides sp.]